MDDVGTGAPTGPAPSQDAKSILTRAREANGLSLAEVATRTRVPVRHLEAIEAGDYASLPSPTYAVGFARAYARAVGADEVEVARLVRAELDRMGPRTPEYVPYETADPARVPSRGIAILGAGLALAVLILAGLFYGTNLFSGSTGDTPPAAEVATTAPAPKPAAQATPKPVSGGQVTLTATDNVWLRVYDADNKTLFIGTMKPGDKFDVPVDAKDPMINVGRPDKLQVTLNGSQLPPLGTGERPIKDVRVSAAAIAARLNGTPEPAPAPATSATPVAATRSAPSARRTSQAVPKPAAPATAAPATSQPSDARSANLAAAAALPKTDN